MKEMEAEEQEAVAFAYEALKSLNKKFVRARLDEITERFKKYTSVCNRTWIIVFHQRTKNTAGKLVAQTIMVEIKLKCSLENRKKYHATHIWIERTATIRINGHVLAKTQNEAIININE